MTIQRFARLMLVLSLLALPAMLSACAHEEEQEQKIDSLQPPPAPEVEVVPTIPDPQQEIWIPGYWTMRNFAFFWVPGKIVPRPSPTAVWAQPIWAHHQYGWSFEMGHWE